MNATGDKHRRARLMPAASGRSWPDPIPGPELADIFVGVGRRLATGTDK